MYVFHSVDHVNERSIANIFQVYQMESRVDTVRNMMGFTEEDRYLFSPFINMHSRSHFILFFQGDESFELQWRMEDENWSGENPPQGANHDGCPILHGLIESENSGATAFVIIIVLSF